MLRIIAVILTAVLSAATYAQTAQEIIQEVIRRDLDRKASVQNYLVNQCTMGQQMILYYEKSQAVLANGETVDTFRLVPPNEIAERQNDGVSLTPTEMELFANGLEQMGDAVGREIEQSGMPAYMLMSPASYDEPWASPDPRVMSGSMAMFMRAAAAAERDRMLNGDNTDIASSEQQLGQLINSAQLVGNETVDGRPSFHIRANDIDYSQVANGGEEFAVDTVSIWVDQDYYVPLQLRMNGSADIDGAPREMFIEMRSLEYQQIGPLYESTRQVMRMGGVMTPEQEAQLAQAQQQLAEARQQLDQLDGQQREMLENMLGPQIAMMNNLVNTGTIEVETLIPRIRVNVGLPDQAEMATELFDSAPCASAGNLFGTPATGFSSNPGATSSNAGIDGAPANTGTSGDGGVPAQTDPTASLAAQQSCLELKIQQAQADRPRRRGFGGLLSGVGQAVSQIGNLDIGGLAGGLFGPGASDEDIEERARELGLTDQDIAECRAAQPEPNAAPALDF